jgi:phosphatidylglycerol---prolipoprotein diacylglyceryl transferase
MLGVLALKFPNIDPIALSIGPFVIKWYGLAYATGMVAGWFYVRNLMLTPALWAPGQATLPNDFASDLLILLSGSRYSGVQAGEEAPPLSVAPRTVERS